MSTLEANKMPSMEEFLRAERFGSERPQTVPGQILSPDEIRLFGKYVRIIGESKVGGLMEVIGLPYKVERFGDTLFLPVSEIFPGVVYQRNFSLEELGVTPNQEGLWNQGCRLVRAELVLAQQV